jgi:hypothetical protein
MFDIIPVGHKEIDITIGDRESYNPNTANQLTRIREQATERYGEGAEFAYITETPQEGPDQPKQKAVALLTLDQAIGICGAYIAEQDYEDSTMLWSMLDKFHERAEMVLSKNEGTIRAARCIGQQALQRHQHARS